MALDFNAIFLEYEAIESSNILYVRYLESVTTPSAFKNCVLTMSAVFCYNTGDEYSLLFVYGRDCET
jgi:hypothetical protein